MKTLFFVFLSFNSFAQLTIPPGVAFVSAAGCVAAGATCTVSPTSACWTANITLTGTGSGTAPLTYTWTGPSGYTSTAQNPTVFNHAVSGTYTLTVTNACGSGSASTTTTTITPTSITATPTNHACNGFTFTLTATPGGGLWSTSNSARVAVGSSSGICTAGLSGTTATITYSVSACTSTLVCSVDASPAAIAIVGGGTAKVCMGATIQFSDGTSGGTWTSSNTGVATVDSTGSHTTITPISSGTATITYTRSNGCYVTAGVTVNTLPTITLGTSPTVLIGTTTANLPYTATTNSPATYDIVFDGTAHAQGFLDVTGGIFPGSSPIAITIPIAPLPGTYNAVLTIYSASPCTSNPTNSFTITSTM